MKPSPPGYRWRADLALAFIALIWGSTFVVVKQALADSSTLLFLALRFSLAAAVLFLALRGWYGRSRNRGLECRAGILAGLCLFAGYAFQTFGLRFTTPSKSAFLTGLSIVLVPLIGSAVHKKAPRAFEVLGVLAATAGMGLMTLEGSSLRPGPGDLLTVACAGAFAVHILVLGHYAKRVSFERLSLVQIATAAGLALATFWWAEVPRIRWSGGVLLALGVTALLATALAFTVQSWAQQHTTPTHTALILALEPVFAWLTSLLAVGEGLSGRAAVGAVLILAGIVLVELKPEPAKTHPQ